MGVMVNPTAPEFPKVSFSIYLAVFLVSGLARACLAALGKQDFRCDAATDISRIFREKQKKVTRPAAVIT
jgi:hypothetical protein